ncbi:15672_t:CDS:1, partial [Acaulospora morrowiae]
ITVDSMELFSLTALRSTNLEEYICINTNDRKSEHPYVNL